MTSSDATVIASAKELAYQKSTEPPYIKRINGEDYDVIKLSVDIPSGGKAPDTFVFLGEGNFTFSAAFASRRDSWDGVVPTTFDPTQQSLKKTAKDWASSLELCAKNAATEDMKNEMKYWMRSRPPPQRNLDATKLGDRETLQKQLGIPQNSFLTLWFQSPWSEGYSGGQINFVKMFMLSAAGVQRHGEVLLIGLCVDERRKSLAVEDTMPHVHYYGKLKFACDEYYECVGADVEFVGEMMRRGYTHEAPAGECSKQFATLLYRRNGNPKS